MQRAEPMDPVAAGPRPGSSGTEGPPSPTRAPTRPVPAGPVVDPRPSEREAQEEASEGRPSEREAVEEALEAAEAQDEDAEEPAPKP